MVKKHSIEVPNYKSVNEWYETDNKGIFSLIPVIYVEKCLKVPNTPYKFYDAVMLGTLPSFWVFEDELYVEGLLNTTVPGDLLESIRKFI